MITKNGEYIIAQCLNSTRKIDHFIISSESNVSADTELEQFTTYDLIPVKDTRITRDVASGKTVLLFSTYENGSSLVTRSIKTVGLVSEGEIVLVEATNKTVGAGDVLNQDYYIPLKIS